MFYGCKVTTFSVNYRIIGIYFEGVLNRHILFYCILIENFGFSFGGFTFSFYLCIVIR